MSHAFTHVAKFERKRWQGRMTIASRVPCVQYVVRHGRGVRAMISSTGDNHETRSRRGAGRGTYRDRIVDDSCAQEH